MTVKELRDSLDYQVSVGQGHYEVEAYNADIEESKNSQPVIGFIYGTGNKIVLYSLRNKEAPATDGN